MESVLERLKAIRDKFDDCDDRSILPSSFWHYKFADVVLDLCRDFECRLTEIERKVEATEAYQREQMDR